MAVEVREDGYPDTPFQSWLARHGACGSARAFVDDATPQEAWDVCQRSDWMEWLCCYLELELPSPLLWACCHQRLWLNWPCLCRIGQARRIRKMHPVLPNFLTAADTRPPAAETSNEPHAAVAEGQSYCASAPRDSSSPSSGVATEVRHEQ